ncbi:hypothetical protein SAMD00023353_11100180 [Rosellinia necatrix]|uniref:Uncharacterized protein n=1 Tax=Rosellinia necatrix TaxID=77044 RepID=A0A1S8AB57_ROSNE|nr:hypothetical protein SAMD00023353_11100180 [Rosellinia necatrix]
MTDKNGTVRLFFDPKEARDPSSSGELVDLGNNTTPKHRKEQRNGNGKGRPAKWAGVNTAEESKGPPTRRSPRIAQLAEQAKRAKQVEVVEQPTKTTSPPETGLDKPKKPRAALTRGTDTVSRARGGRSPKTVSSKASKPQGIVKKRGGPRKTT